MVGDVVVVSEEEVGVVAALSQLHHQVGEGGLADLPGVVGVLQGGLLGDVLVYHLLPCGQLYLDDVLFLVRQF